MTHLDLILEIVKHSTLDIDNFTVERVEMLMGSSPAIDQAEEERQKWWAKAEAKMKFIYAEAIAEEYRRRREVEAAEKAEYIKQVREKLYGKRV